MAKQMKRWMAMVFALVFCASILVLPANAKGGWGGGGGGSSQYFEWYKVYVNGKLAAQDQGPNGNHTWLVQGVYSWDVSVSGTTMTWRAGKHKGTVDLSKFITIPEGFEVAEGGYVVEHKSVEGTNSQSAQFDNAIITVVITVLYNEDTGETIPVDPGPEPTDPIPPEPTEPEPTEPEPTEPEPTEPEPTEPEPSEPEPTEPEPTEPEPTEPEPTEPAPTEPAPVTEPAE